MRFHGTYLPRGVFVCFEGGDGSGKSTQSRLLAERLEALGHVVRLTFEPGDTPVGKEMRRIVLSPETGELSHRTEVLLYAADKSEHVDTVVIPALERGEVVVTDRYVDSTLAYQGAGRDLDVRRGRGGRTLGDRRHPAAPDGRPRRGPARRPRPLRGPGPDRGRGPRVPRPGPTAASSTWPPPTRTTTSSSTGAATATCSPTRSWPGSSRCSARRPRGPARRHDRPSRRARSALLRNRLGRPGRPAPDRRAAAHRGGRPRHEPRVAVHRTARLGPLQRRHRLRRGAAVRAGEPGRQGVRHLPAVPHRAGRVAPRRDAGPHGVAVHRRQGHPRARAPSLHEARRAAAGRSSSSRTPTG